MIRDTIQNYLSRASDYVFSGRNRSRIILGTDRETTRDSGFGDGGDNDVNSSVVDIVAGFNPSSGDNDLKNDKSRIYIAEKTNPDSYFDINVGNAVEGESSIISISDHIRIKGRKTIKIVGKDFSIVAQDNGEVEIKSASRVIVSCDEIRLGSVDASEAPAWASKVLSELQKLQAALNGAVAPSGGGPVTFSNPYIPPTTADQIGATKTKIS